jgi:hypothetical protein
LSQEETFCPACGAQVNGQAADKKEMAIADSKNEDRIKIAFWILVISAAMGLIFGVYTYLTAADFAKTLFDIIDGVSPGVYTEESLASLLRWSAVMTMVGGAVSAFTAFLALKRRLWVLTVILSVVSAFGFIFCLISAWLLYKAKLSFKD